MSILASAPLVGNPTGLAFDEDGRLFVAEITGAPASAASGGRIRVLEDSDGDGVYDSSAVFADNLPRVGALCCYDGGVFASVGREILFLKDTRGTGVADLRRPALTGFGSTNVPADLGLSLGALAWGPDNRIHGVTAGLGGTVGSGSTSESISLNGLDFSFDPRTLQVQPEIGTGQSGIAFDEYGRRFVTDFSRPLRIPVVPFHYVARNPFVVWSNLTADVYPPTTPIFRLTQLVATNASQPTSAGQARSTNITTQTWMARARDGLIYRGGALPTNFLGSMFIPDPDAQIIHRSVLRQEGLLPIAARASDEAANEFVRSGDPAFRPMQVTQGPDGALYVADVGNAQDDGRVYRLALQSNKTSGATKLSRSPTRDLLALFSSLNCWQRETAARILYQRQDPGAVVLLSNVLANSRQPLARAQALNALAGQTALTEPHILRALRDPDVRVRLAALRCMELLRNPGGSDALFAQLRSMVRDPALLVRYQLILSLGEFRRQGRTALLAELLTRDIAEPLVAKAVLSSLATDAGEMFILLAGNARFRATPPGRAFLIELSEMLGTQGQIEQVTAVIDFLSHNPVEQPLGFSFLTALGEGLRHTASSLALNDPSGRLQPYYTSALDVALNGPTPASRAQAVRLLAVSPMTYAEAGDWLLVLANPNESPLVQSEVIRTLSRFDEPRVLPDLLQRWQQFSPTIRREAAAALLSRVDRAAPMLLAVQNHIISLSDIPSLWLNYLRANPDPAVRQRALQLLGPSPTGRTTAVAAFAPALRLTGSATIGRGVFTSRCSNCHPFERDNQSLPSELATARLYGKQKLLSTIIDPSSNTGGRGKPFGLQTRKGEVGIGGIRDLGLSTVSFRQPNGNTAIWPRDTIVRLEPIPGSLMPDGLEQGLSVQDMANLLAFLIGH